MSIWWFDLIAKICISNWCAPDPTAALVRRLHLIEYSPLEQMATAFWHIVGATLQPLLRVADKTKITGKVKPRRAVLPVAPKPVEASSLEEIDSHLDQLDSHKDQWVQLDTRHRAQLLTECLKNTMALAEQFARTGTAAKGSYEGGLGDEM